MQTHKSGILALVLGVAVLGAAACEKKTEVVTPPPPVAVTLTIAPKPVPTLIKGQTVQLVAIVAGNSNQAATWTSSNALVASVSPTGLVTALTKGVTVVTAVSAADATARDAVTISVDTVVTGPGTTIGQPSITISSVNVSCAGIAFCTPSPVNPGNVAGVIDVTLNVDIPTGVNASAVRVTLDGTEVCRQSFASGGSADAAIEAVPQIINCTINTARLGPNGTALFLNGTHVLKAEVLGPTGTVIANATYQPLVFNNVDVIAATITTSKGPAVDQNNLSWRGGDVTVTLTPAIYSGTPNTVTSVSVSLSNSGAAAIEGGAVGCETTGRALPLAGCPTSTVTKTATTSTNNAFSVTFPASATFAGGTGVGGIEDPAPTFTVSGLTTAGQNFGGGTTLTFNNAVLTNGTFATNNQLRLDNLAPRVTFLDITAATLGCAPNTACYVNGGFNTGTSASTYSSTSVTSGFSRTVDYGVDRQTITFAAGPSSSSLVTFTSPSTLAETQVANTNVLQATVVDALLNSRSVFATDIRTCVTASSTSVSAANQQPGSPSCVGVTTVQKFGVDLTPPTETVSGNGNGVATAPAPGAANTFTFSASDAGVGPSAIKQFNVKVEQITPAGTVCLTPTGGLFAGTGSCTTAAGGVTTVAAAGNPAAATVTLPDASAYYRITVTAQDFAGNVSAPAVVVQLRDFVAPIAGGLSTPSSISGNTTASFSAPIQDDVELGDILPSIGFTENAVNVYLANPRRTIGTYGFDVFNNTDPGAFTVDNFIRSIETTTAAGTPTGVISRATIVQMDTRDVAGVQLGDVCPTVGAGDNATTQNCRQRESNILNAVAFGIGGPGTETSFSSAGRAFGTGVNNQGTFFGQTTSTGAVPPANTNVCSNNPVGANAGCNVVTATSVTLFAQANGPSQTFAAPFGRLNFYAVDPATGRAFLVCTSGAPTAVDNTVNNTRTWTYSCTWSPQTQTNIPNTAGVYQTFALGVDASGRSLQSQNRQITLTSD